jgi:hypothetical protein
MTKFRTLLAEFADMLFWAVVFCLASLLALLIV